MTTLHAIVGLAVLSGTLIACSEPGRMTDDPCDDAHPCHRFASCDMAGLCWPQARLDGLPQRFGDADMAALLELDLDRCRRGYAAGCMGLGSALTFTTEDIWRFEQGVAYLARACQLDGESYCWLHDYRRREAEARRRWGILEGVEEYPAGFSRYGSRATPGPQANHGRAEAFCAHTAPPIPAAPAKKGSGP
jgi:hypothetical protein